jgi:Mrp family chromosome partitioning ATPase
MNGAGIQNGVSVVGIPLDEQFTLLTDYDTGSAFSESYRTLYINIRSTWDHDPAKEPSTPQCHALLLATPSAYADYAAVAANLAIVAAQSGTPTILVDADLKNPRLQQRFGMSQSAGLSELLAEEVITPQKVDSYLQTTFVPGLRLLCAGAAKGQGSSLLFSPRLEELLCNTRLLVEELESKTGIVIFNSLPVLSGADASLIGALVEQTFLTIAAGHTTRTQAKQAQEQLQRTHAKLAGIIMFE